MSRPRGNNSRPHSPENRVGHWQQTEVAYLADPLSHYAYPIHYIVQTVLHPEINEGMDDGTTHLQLTPYNSEQVSQRFIGGKLFADWRFNMPQNPIPRLAELGPRAIRIAGKPPAALVRSTNPENKQRSDTLYLGGPLEVGSANDPQVRLNINLGTVVGLTLHASNQEFVVWTPRQP